MINDKWFILLASSLAQIGLISSAIAQEASDRNLDLSPEVIEDSPVLQEWLKEVPNVLEDIKNDPAFATRLGIGFTTFAGNDAAGISLAIKDIFIKSTRFTLSADYQTTFNGDNNAVGADIHYFLFPLGNYINFAPLVGYRYVQNNDFFTDGIHVGLRMMLALSRTGAGDISVSQSFIAPGGSSQEVGITSLSVGYGITSHLRLSTDIERLNTVEDKDNRFGVNLEWLF